MADGISATAGVPEKTRPAPGAALDLGSVNLEYCALPLYRFKFKSTQSPFCRLSRSEGTAVDGSRTLQRG